MLIQVLSNRYDMIRPYLEHEQIQFVLLQDGVYLLPQLLEAVSPDRVGVLEADWRASGMANQLTNTDALANLITHAQWVELCLAHNNVMTIQ